MLQKLITPLHFSFLAHGSLVRIVIVLSILTNLPLSPTGTVPVLVWRTGGGLPCPERGSESTTGLCGHRDCQWNQSSRAASWREGRAASQHYQQRPAGSSRERSSYGWGREGSQKRGAWGGLQHSHWDSTSGGRQQRLHCHCGGLSVLMEAWPCLFYFLFCGNVCFSWMLFFFFKYTSWMYKHCKALTQCGYEWDLFKNLIICFNVNFQKEKDPN